MQPDPNKLFATVTFVHGIGKYAFTERSRSHVRAGDHAERHAHVFEELTKLGIHVNAFDLAGHGKSAKATGSLSASQTFHHYLGQIGKYQLEFLASALTDFI